MSAAETYVREAPSCPTLRISREPDGAISVDVNEAEWIDPAEAHDFATWLLPIVQACADHDEIARAIGAEPVSLRRIGDEIGKLTRDFVYVRKLLDARASRARGRPSPARWRFTAGRFVAEKAVSPC